MKIFIVRDMEYIDNPLVTSLRIDNTPGPAVSHAPYRIYNTGNNNTVQLLGFIHVLEECIGKKANLNMLPMQKGDMKATFANMDALNEAVGFKPSTSIETGLYDFVDWYRQYYQ